MEMRRKITEQEKLFIKSNWKKLSVQEMGYELDRHPGIVRRQAIKLGLVERKPKKYVSDHQKRRIVTLYWENKTDEQIAEILDLQMSTVVAHRLKAGLARRETKGMFEGWCDDLTGLRRQMICGVWK